MQINELEARRRELRMSRPALARLSRVSLPTVNRILSGRYESARFSAIRAIAEVLGMPLSFKPVRADVVLERRAERVAEKVVRQVQGTSGLEGQAVDAQTLRRMRRATERELLSGSRRRLWDSP
jgi:transcriptional regulator with XRE-family HTH domain